MAKKIDPKRRDWTLITKSRGGTVSILKELTLAEALATYERLDQMYGQTYRVPKNVNSYSYGGRICADGDIELRQIVGPEGWTMPPTPQWPKFVKVDDDRHADVSFSRKPGVVA